jgi:hypothetical protein
MNSKKKSLKRKMNGAISGTKPEFCTHSGKGCNCSSNNEVSEPLLHDLGVAGEKLPAILRISYKG